MPGAEMRLVGRELAVEAQQRGGDQDLLRLVAGIVQQIARAEIIAAIGDDVVIGNQARDILVVQALLVLDHLHFRIELGESRLDAR